MGSSSQSAWFQQKYWCSGSRRHWTRIAATYAAHVTIANIILSSLVHAVWPLEAKSEPVFSGAFLQAAAEHMDSKWKTLTMKRMNTGPSIEVMNKWLTVVINIPIHKSGFWVLEAGLAFWAMLRHTELFTPPLYSSSLSLVCFPPP